MATDDLRRQDSYPIHIEAERERLIAEFERIEEERRRLEAGARELAATQRRLAHELEQLHNERLQLQKERGELYKTAEQQARELLKHHENLSIERGRLEDERRRLYEQVFRYAETFRAEAQALREEIAGAEKALRERESELEQRFQILRSEEARLLEIGERTTERAERVEEELYRIAGMTPQQAREEVRRQLFEEVKAESAAQISKIEERVKEEADQRAARILATVMQRIAPEAVNEVPVSVVQLPSEDFKARIIGKDGRNIRTLESKAGVELKLDDVPEAVVISTFDPVRKEKTRLCLEELIADGRIQPSRIEETYERVERRLERELFEAGEEAALEFGFKMQREILQVLGSLKLWTSGGQNVLAHLRESARIARMIAEELQIDPTVATRAALLHDLGKGLRHKYEGSHARVGAEFARHHGEPEPVCHAIEAHHNEIQPRSVDAVLVQIADHLSGGRPGARKSGSDEDYIKRLTDLERVCKSIKGVQEAYAFGGGREIRVIVDPGRIDDADLFRFPKEIAKEIEREGYSSHNLRITVIREVRRSEEFNIQQP